MTYATYNPGSTTAKLASTSTRITGTSPGIPVFVLKTGMVLAVGNYTYQDGRISYELASGGTGVISTDEVDWTTTTQVNLQRGVRVSLPGGHSSAGVPGSRFRGTGSRAGSPNGFVDAARLSEKATSQAPLRPHGAGRQRMLAAFFFASFPPHEQSKESAHTH